LENRLFFALIFKSCYFPTYRFSYVPVSGGISIGKFPFHVRSQDLFPGNCHATRNGKISAGPHSVFGILALSVREDFLQKPEEKSKTLTDLMYLYRNVEVEQAKINKSL